MALRRNLGHASNKAAIAMMAGLEVNGQFSDPRLISKYGHRAAIAHRIQSEAFHDCISRSSGGVVVGLGSHLQGVREHAARLRIFEVCENSADAANQNVIQTGKVHVSSLSSCVVGPLKIEAAW